MKPPKRRRRGVQDGVFKKNGWWWLDFQDQDGKRRREKAAPDYETAKALYRQKMTARARGELTGIRAEGLCLRDFVEDHYWPKVAPLLSPDWAERTRIGILNGQLLPRFGDVSLTQLRPEAIQSWYAERLGEVKASTANKELTRLRHLLRRAVRWGYLRVNPAAELERRKDPDGRVRYLSDDERRLLLDGKTVEVVASDGRRWPLQVGPNPDLRLYILAALHTGGRRSELIRLTWGNVDLKRRQLTFSKTKNRRERTVPLTDSLAAALAARPRPLSRTAPLLPPYEPKVLSRSFARLCERLGLEDLRFHDLRHDVPSQLPMRGVSQRVVMESLGHREPRMTIKYQHLAPGHLRAAMEALDAAMSTPAPGAREEAAP